MTQVKRTKEIKVRYSDEEYEQAKENANGLLAVWLRDISLLKKPKKKIKPINKELIYELNKIGVNLNQIAKLTHTVELTSEEKIKVLLSMATIAEHLRELRENYDS